MNRPVHVLHVLEATGGGTRRWLENVVRGLDPARATLALWMIEARPPAYVLAAPLLLLAAAGFFTPLFVGQVLAPVVLHGLP